MTSTVDQCFKSRKTRENIPLRAKICIELSEKYKKNRNCRVSKWPVLRSNLVKVEKNEIDTIAYEKLHDNNGRVEKVSIVEHQNDQYRGEMF